MRIGIDARFLTHPQVGGFKTYTQNLINALSQLKDNNDYVIYIDRYSSEGTLPQSINFTYRVVKSTFPVIGMPVREQIGLSRTIANDRLDMVHFLCNTAPIGLSMRFVVTLHDTIQVTHQQPFRLMQGLGYQKRWAMMVYSKWAITKSVKSARRVITVSHYEKDNIAEVLGIGLQKINVTHLAPNPVFKMSSPETRRIWRDEILNKFSIGRKFILGVGYESRKNIPILINAFALLANKYPSLDLVVVVVEAQSRAIFQQLVYEKHLRERTRFLPALSPDELVMFYNLAEVFVYPSERESFGLPPLEALACGTPTIAMNMSSLPEILQGGALLVEGKDPQIWTNAIDQVLTQKNLRDNLVTRGLERALEFTWQHCAMETIKVYEAALEEP